MWTKKQMARASFGVIAMNCSESQKICLDTMYFQVVY